MKKHGLNYNYTEQIRHSQERPWLPRGSDIDGDHVFVLRLSKMVSI